MAAAVNLGELEQVIRDVGGDDVLRKMGLIDAAGQKLGARPIAIGFTAPGLPTVAQGMNTMTSSVSQGLQVIALLGRTQGTLSATSAALTSATLGLTAALDRLTLSERRATDEEDRGNAVSETAEEAAERKRRGAERYAEALAKQKKAVEGVTDAEYKATKAAWEAEGRAARAMRQRNQSAGPMLGPGLPGMTTADAVAASAAAGGVGGAVAATNQLAASQQKAAQASDQHGAALNRTTQRASIFGRELVKADGQLTSFSKRGISALNGVAFGFAQMATSGEMSLRSIAGSATQVAAFLGKGGAIGSIIGTIGLAAFDVFRAGERRRFEVRAMLSKAAARDELTTEKSRLDLLETTEKSAFDRGLVALNKFYDKRATIITDRAAAEARSRIQQAEALEQEARDREKFITVGGKTLPEALRNETIKQAAELRSQAKSLRVEAAAATEQGSAEQQRLIAERAAAERQLQSQLLDFENKRRTAIGETHQVRLKEIEQEIERFNLLPLPTDDKAAAVARLFAVSALGKALRDQAALEQAQTDFQRLQADLDRNRLIIQQEVNAGKLSQVEAERQIASIEQSSVPTLNEILDRMERFAGKNEEALATIRQMRQEVKGLGVDLSPLEEAVFSFGQGLKGDLDTIGLTLGGTLGTSLAAGFSSAFTKGSGKSFIEQFGLSMLSAIGNVIVQLGGSLLTYGLLMSGLIPFAAGLAPFLPQIMSAPAAIAAGTGLIALGAGMGAIAANNSGSRTGGGGGGSTSFAPPPDAVNRITLDPDRRLRERAENESTAVVRAANAGAQNPLAPIVNHFTVIGPNDPVAQRGISELIVNTERAGYPVGSRG